MIKAAGKTLNYAKYSMLSLKHSAKYVCRTGTSASSTARAVTSYEMIRQRTRSTSSQFLTSFLFPTSTSGKVDHTVTDTERKKGIKNITLANQLQKKCKKREFLSIHDRFIRDARFRKTTIELCRTEKVIRRDGQISERGPHTHTCHRRRTQRMQ